MISFHIFAQTQILWKNRQKCHQKTGLDSESNQRMNEFLDWQHYMTILTGKLVLSHFVLLVSQKTRLNPIFHFENITISLFDSFWWQNNPFQAKIFWFTDFTWPIATNSQISWELKPNWASPEAPIESKVPKANTIQVSECENLERNSFDQCKKQLFFIGFFNRHWLSTKLANFL